MICKNKKCAAELQENSVFCHICGKDQRAKPRRKQSGILIPKARQLPSGNWFIQLRIDGESIPITEDTEDKCEAMAMSIKSGLIAAKKKPDDITLREACTEYIESRRSRLSPVTIEGYEIIRDTHFKGIMDRKLADLSWNVIDKAIADECDVINQYKRKMSPKTVKNAFGFIKSVLKSKKIEFDEGFRLPEVKRIPIQIVPAADVFDAVKGSVIELPCLLAMWLSMTVSEIRGLTKSKSIRNNQITVLETVVRTTKSGDIRKAGSKETERARTQDIPPYIQNLIDELDDDVICPLTAGAINRRLKRLLAKHGLPIISFHKLRHVSASSMAALSIPANYAQEKGGWKTDHVMKRVYTHTFTSERKEADRKMDEFFNEIVGEKVQNANDNANEVSEN
jgi:integrase